MIQRFSVFTLAALLFVTSAPAFAYYGHSSTEANLTYAGRIELNLPDAPDGLTSDELNDRSGEIGKSAYDQAAVQIKHLMGFFLSKYMKQDLGFPFQGALGETWSIQFNHLAKIKGSYWVADYAFSGKTIFLKDAFSQSTKVDVPIVLPVYPPEVYDLSLRDGISTCVDKENEKDDRDDFWYDWDLAYPNCTLRGDTTHLIATTGQLEEIPNTTSTYPDYPHLYGNNQAGPVLQIAAFFGYIGGSTPKHHVNRRDDGYYAMNQTGKYLQSLGYSETQVLSGFRMYRDGRIVHDGHNILRVYENDNVEAGGRHIAVRVQMLIAETDTDTKDVTFERYFTQALGSADIVTYDGHSGLGAYLALERFTNVVWNPDKYQIFFLDGCSTYPYFNGKFINAKGGRNTNVVTSGTATLTNDSVPNDEAFLDPFVRGLTPSWQEIMDALDKSNAQDDGSFLMGVNGDELNTWRP